MTKAKIFPNFFNGYKNKKVFATTGNHFMLSLLFITMLLIMVLSFSCMTPAVVPYDASSIDHYEYHIRKGFGNYAGRGGTNHNASDRVRHLGGSHTDRE